VKPTPPAIGTSAIHNNFESAASDAGHLLQTETRRTSGVAPGWGADDVFRVGPGRNVREKWPTCKRQPNWPTNDQRRPNAFRVCVSISARHKYSASRPSSPVATPSTTSEKTYLSLYGSIYCSTTASSEANEPKTKEDALVSIWSDSICPS